MIFKHKRTVLAIFGSIVAVITAWSLITRPTYEATTRIAIKVEYGLAGSTSLSTEISPERLVRSELEFLAASTTISEVINEIGLQQLYPDIYEKYLDSKDLSSRDMAIVMFQENLKTKASGKTDAITVSFRHSNPTIAAQVVNNLVERLKRRHIPVIVEPEPPVLAKVRSKKPVDTPKGRETKGADRTPEESPESLLKQKEELASKVSAIEAELSKTNIEISTVEAMVQDIKSRLSESQRRAGVGEITVSGGEPVGVIQQRLEQLRQKEQSLLKIYKETSGAVILVRQEIQREEKLLAREENVEYRRALAGGEQELKTLRARAASQKTDFNQNRFRLAKVERALEEVIALEAQREEARAKEEAARKAAQAPKIRVSVLEQALPPTKPILPMIPLNIAVAVVLGLVSGIGAAVIAEHRSHTFNVPKDVEERLGISVLASVDQPRLQERMSSE